MRPIQADHGDQSGSRSQLQWDLHLLHVSGKCKPLAYRLHYLKQVAKLIEENTEVIGLTVRSESGEDDYQALLKELERSTRELSLTIDRVESWMRDVRQIADSAKEGIPTNGPLWTNSMGHSGLA